MKKMLTFHPVLPNQPTTTKSDQAPMEMIISAPFTNHRNETTIIEKNTVEEEEEFFKRRRDARPLDKTVEPNSATFDHLQPAQATAS